MMVGTHSCLSLFTLLNHGCPAALPTIFWLPHSLTAREERFDYVSMPLIHPRQTRDVKGVSSARKAPLTRSDLALDSKQWGTLIVGKISEWIDLESDCNDVAAASESAMKEELALATHLSLAAALLPAPSLRCANYARCLNQFCQSLTYVQAWVRLPTDCPIILTQSFTDPPFRIPLGSKAVGTATFDMWEAWNQLRIMCEHKGLLYVALDIGAQLPPAKTLQKWLAEPVRVVLISTASFLTNQKGFPTLPKSHQQFITSLIPLKVQFLIRGRALHANGYLPYMQYLEHLKTRMPALTEAEKFEGPYADFLQSPLQPLMDNLESQTYEAFEKDPVKYAQYEAAILKALRYSQRHDKDRVSVVMVVGAGRGPLVSASIRASKASGRQIELYAVEKNPNAVITLRNLVASDPDWAKVTVVATDMREWETELQADIMVSELLGSFGDNELSPECLDGAQKFLAPNGRVSIPFDYTSYVAPMCSHKLWQDASSFGDLKKLETAYVVKLHNFHQLAPEQPCFRFEHPNYGGLEGRQAHDNRRRKEITFRVEEHGMLHGFAGYFDSTLYGDVMISITPSTFSEGMFSWFPLFIPLRTPVELKAGDKVTACFWRCTAGGKVWYEWALLEPVASPIHNVNGRSYWIGT
ncbi:unnamed protein product [Chrysoparadoxa australica]